MKPFNLEAALAGAIYGGMNHEYAATIPIEWEE